MTTTPLNHTPPVITTLAFDDEECAKMQIAAMCSFTGSSIKRINEWIASSEDIRVHDHVINDMMNTPIFSCKEFFVSLAATTGNPLSSKRKAGETQSPKEVWDSMSKETRVLCAIARLALPVESVKTLIDDVWLNTHNSLEKATDQNNDERIEKFERRIDSIGNVQHTLEQFIFPLYEKFRDGILKRDIVALALCYDPKIFFEFECDELE